MNGFDYETYVPKTEPFNEALDMQVHSAEAERIQWEATLGELRKGIPAQISRGEAELEEVRTRAEWLPEGEDDEQGRSMVLCTGSICANVSVTKRAADIPPPPRHDEVRETFDTVAANIAELVQVSGCGMGVAVVRTCI